MAERQILRDTIGIRRINDGTLAEPTAALGVFALQQVAFAGVAAHDFTGAGDFESFGYGFLRFNTFRASHKFYFNCKGRALYPADVAEASAIFSSETCLSGN